MNEPQFNAISEWQNKTFGESTPLSKIAHLADELQELVDDLKNNNPNRRLEFADCFFLLFGAAASDGMSYQDICQAIQEKFEINKARKWGNPDENGVVKHISDEPETLNKQQTIQALKEGKKLTHRYFSEGEFVRQPDPEKNTYQFEDGVQISSDMFWLDRSIEQWDTDWEIIE